MFDLPSLEACNIQPVVNSCKEDDRNDWFESMVKGAEKAMIEKREELVKKAIGRATGRNGDIVLQAFGNRLVLVKLAHMDVDRYMLDGVGLVDFYSNEYNVSRRGMKITFEEKYKMLV